MNIPALRWILVAACLVAVAAAAGSYEDEYEDEEPAAPPPSPVKVRPSPLARQARGPIVPGRPSPKNAVTQKTTTTEAPAEYEDEEGEGEEVAGGDEDHSTTSEAPKRGGVRSGGVRPFRSNADLLETLKKRRQQHVSDHNSAPKTPSTTTSAPANQEKSFKGGRRAGKVADQTGSNSERKPTFNRNSRVKSAPATSEPAAVEQAEEPRTRGFRSRKF